MSKRFGPGLFVVIFVVAEACLSGPALADQTHVAYDLAPGAKTLPIAIPISNSPVVMSCVQNVGGDVGEGQATIIRSLGDRLLDWSGYDYVTAGFTRGFTATAGAHIIWCDFSGQLDIEVASSTQVEVVNKSSETLTGVVMFTY